jgi:NAD-dependent dihydropyrimidine dehydrogenase PreA subunit
MARRKLPRVELPADQEIRYGAMTQAVDHTGLVRTVAYCEFGGHLYIERGQPTGLRWYKAWDCRACELVEVEFGLLVSDA